jgi:hypothetical protein
MFTSHGRDIRGVIAEEGGRVVGRCKGVRDRGQRSTDDGECLAS